MEEYAEQSFSSLLYLLVELCGTKDLQVDHALSHLGKAQGLTTLLRAIPYKGRTQSLNIPQVSSILAIVLWYLITNKENINYFVKEILVKHGVSQERVVRDVANDKGVEDCVFDVATAAHQHLKKVCLCSI